MDQEQDGRSPLRGSGHSAEPEPVPVSAAPAASVPNAEYVADLLPETRAFLRDWLDWLDWVECEAPDLTPYSRGEGLCLASLDYAGSETEADAIDRDLHEAFEASDYPFGDEDYRSRERGRTMHKCPKRLAWARANAAEPQP